MISPLPEFVSASSQFRFCGPSGRLRFFSLVGLFCLIASLAVAQQARYVDFYRMDEYAQTNALSRKAQGSSLLVYVYFNEALVEAQTVVLHNAHGSFTLKREDAHNFSLVRDYSSPAEREAEFPDGNYSIDIFGNSASPIVFSLTTPESPIPTLITNGDALQNWPTEYPEVKWGRLNIIAANEVNIVVSSQDTGDIVFQNRDVSAYDRSAFVHAPFREDLWLDLIVTKKVATTATNNVSTITLHHGYDLYLPIYSQLQPAWVLTQPKRYQVGMQGGSVFFEGSFLGADLSVSLMKDSVTVPQAKLNLQVYNQETRVTYELPIEHASDAGDYTIVATNSAGNSSSIASTVVVPAKYRVTTIAGAYTAGDADGPAETARFTSPQGIALDDAGNFYITDTDAHTIRKLTPGGIVSTLAGASGQSGNADGTGSSARFDRPWGIAVDHSGNVYVADRGNHNIRKITPAGVVTTLAGSTAGFRNGVGTDAQFNEPRALAIDDHGVLYVGDYSSTVRKITPAGVVSTLTGPDNAGPDDASIEAFQSVGALACDNAGNVYAAGRHLWKIKPDGTRSVVLTMGADGIGVDTGAGDGKDSVEPFINTMAIGPSGVLYTAAGNALRRVMPNGVAEEIAGGGYIVGLKDGVGVSAQFYDIRGLVCAPSGALFMCDYYSHAIRKATLEPGSTDPMINLTPMPAAQAVKKGTPVSLYAHATGPGLSYQWLKNGLPIFGATNPMLEIRSAADADAADYSVIVGNGVGAVTSLPEKLTLTSTADVGRIINLSVRAPVDATRSPLIVGFVVRGGSSASKSILARAVGPTLAEFGVGHPLPNPSLKLYQGTQQIATNDDWGGGDTLSASFTKTGAFALEAASLDAAWLGNLGSGNYSIHVVGNDETGGVALAEIYDANNVIPSVSTPKLVNVSSLSYSGTGGDALAAGFVIGGASSRTLLIRGIGPALSDFGVTDVLNNPQLAIYQGSTLIATNISGSDTFASTIAGNVGAFWADYRNAALVITLPPGVYSAVVSDVYDQTGNALLEIYDVQ